MNLLELGATLKRERERRGLSVRDVMEATKISRRNVSALEAGEVRALPHPVYLKGYVRNYARLVGLDPEPFVAAVEQQHDGESRYLAQPAPQPVAPQPTPEPAAPQSAAPQPTPEPAAPQSATPQSATPQSAAPEPESAPEPIQAPARRTPEEAPLLRLSVPEPLGQPTQKKSSNGLAVAALLLLVAVLAGLLYQYQRMQDEPAPAPAAPAAAVSAPSVANATDATAAAPLSDNATLPEPAALQPAQPASGAPALPATAVLSGEPPRKAPEIPAQSVSGTSIEVSRQAGASAPAAKPAPAQNAPEVRVPGVQTLTITAKPKEVCWVGVYEGDRATTFLLRDGESRQVNFGKRARLRLGNAGGSSVRLNGEPYPFEGERGQKVTLEFGTR